MVRKIQRYILIILIVLMTNLLSACQLRLPFGPRPIMKVGDGGFLSGEPCGPPCFWNITPDVSKKQDAIEALQAHFDKDFNSQNCELWSGPDIFQDISCNPVYIGFNQTRDVGVIGFPPGIRITVEDAISKYGPPSAISVASIRGDKRGFTISVAMSIYFDDIYTQANLPEQDGKAYFVEPSTIINWIAYLGKDEWKSSMKFATRPWQGYSGYEGPPQAGP